MSAQLEVSDASCLDLASWVNYSIDLDSSNTVVGAYRHRIFEMCNAFAAKWRMAVSDQRHQRSKLMKGEWGNAGDQPMLSCCRATSFWFICSFFPAFIAMYSRVNLLGFWLVSGLIVLLVAAGLPAASAHCYKSNNSFSKNPFVCLYSATGIC